MSARDEKFISSTDGSRLCIGIAVARFSAEIADGLLASCSAALAKLGVNATDIEVFDVPGALELPLALQKMAQTGRFDALIALGAVIRGDTYHFEIVAEGAAAGIMQIALDLGMPIANGVLTTDEEDQAKARMTTKGAECAAVAIEMVNLLKHIEFLKR